MSEKTVKQIVKARFAVIPTHHYPAEYGGGIVPDDRRDFLNDVLQAYERERKAFNELAKEAARLMNAQGLCAPFSCVGEPSVENTNVLDNDCEAVSNGDSADAMNIVAKLAELYEGEADYEL